MVGRTVAVLVFACIGWASPALGHPLIEEARQQFESADFDGALALLTTAENTSDLSRDDLVELIELRAIVNEALDNDDSVSRDLRALASLDPGHQFRPEASPILVEQFQSISSEPIGLSVEVVQEGDDSAIEAVVDNDLGGLVRRIVLRGRATGRGLWQQSEEQRLVIVDASSEGVEWTAEVFGPGQARLLSQSGSSDGVVNHAVEAEPSEPEPVDGEVQENGETDDGTTTRRRRRWPIWLSVGVASAIIIGVVAGVLATRDDSDEYTQVDGPFIGEN